MRAHNVRPYNVIWCDVDCAPTYFFFTFVEISDRAFEASMS